MRVGVAVVIALLLAAPAAHGDEYDAAMARAAAVKEKALDENDPASWLETYRLFEEADAIRSTKESKYEIAIAATKIKSDDIAYQAYEDALALGLDGPAAEKARGYLSEHAGTVARLHVTGPAGAAILVGTRKRGNLPLTRALIVFAGTVRVTITHEGKTIEKTATVSAGTTSTVDFTEPPPPPPKPALPPAPPPVVDTPRRTSEWTLVAIGGGVAALGAITWITAQRTIDLTRASLAETCAVRNGDRCTETYPEYVSYAKSDVDRIASWKAVRASAIVTTAIGGLVIGYGLFRFASAPSRTAALMPRISVGATSVFLGVDGSF
jgi:hypothetical protein